ncbi:hypothetical protein MHYP_G00014460 [Metynnis hypsauchen]
MSLAEFPPSALNYVGISKKQWASMENFLKGRDIWLVNSVCLMASYLWRKLWDLFSYRRKGRASSSSDAQMANPSF